MPGILPGAGQLRTEVLLLPEYWMQLQFLTGYQGEEHLPGYQHVEHPSAEYEEEAKSLTIEEKHEEEARFLEAEI